MAEQDYEPPRVWKWNESKDGKFANINRPTAGATHDKLLPVGKHPLQLYSLATPNGVKVTIMLEELLAAGVSGAEYDAYPVNILEGDQFGRGFVDVNPNSKIPALVDHSGDEPLPIFESGSILLYLAEKFKHFIPEDIAGRTACLNWLFWQMGAGPFVGGGFGHFYCYAPQKIEYAIDRFTLETKRQLDLIDKQLAKTPFIAGEDYTIADIAIWSWYGQIALGDVYDAQTFLGTSEYKRLLSWAEGIAARPAVKRGIIVNKTWGEPHEQLHERHDAADFETKTQDKVAE